MRGCDIGRIINSALVVHVISWGMISGVRASEQSEICSYSDWAWNSHDGQAEEYREVQKLRSELRQNEHHLTLPCSICRQDQAEILLPGLQPIQVCKAIASEVEMALSIIIESGFELEHVVGYRVGRTKGALNERGQRTEYSNHSFGIALDINPERNGLYDSCEVFSESCRLIRGGAWRPGISGTVTHETIVYHELFAIGWRWGGDLRGRQKDFMHFSPSGD